LRRSSDGKEQENKDDDERQTDGHPQEMQDQPVIRSTTVLLKRSADKDQQGYKPEETDRSLEPPQRNARYVIFQYQMGLITYNYK